MISWGQVGKHPDLWSCQVPFAVAVWASWPLWMLHSIVGVSEQPQLTLDRSCSKENHDRLYYSFSSSALFFSSSGSNGNSSSWSSLGLEGDLYEDNLSFPTSDRLVQSRNLKTDESFTTNAWCHILKTMWVTMPICIKLLFSHFWHDSAW